MTSMVELRTQIVMRDHLHAALFAGLWGGGADDYLARVAELDAEIQVQVKAAAKK